MKRVLVAEDEASIREFVVINLERSGYTVEQAADGAEALELFREHNGEFDVVILMLTDVPGSTMSGSWMSGMVGSPLSILIWMFTTWRSLTGVTCRPDSSLSS